MKKLLIIAAFIGLTASCGNTVDKPQPSEPAAFVVFDNSQGICTVFVYDDYRRRETDKIAEVNAGRVSAKIGLAHGGPVTFYYKYIVTIKGIDGLALGYIPEIGKDQNLAQIEEGVTTGIRIPPLNGVLPSADALLSNDCYLFIQNNSFYSFRLYRELSELKPENISTAVVNDGKEARYKIVPGAASSFKILAGANDYKLPDTPPAFEPGHIYCFDFDGGITLARDIEIKLENVNGFTLPEAPGAPLVITSNGSMELRWDAVEGAASYEVWHSTVNDTDSAAKYGSYDAVTLSAAISGLDNGTVYYVWVRAKDFIGVSSGFSPSASGIPLGTPEAPAISIGHRSLTITWEDVAGADMYEVYYGTGTAETLATTTAGTAATITGLSNGTAYSVRIRAANASGVSDYGPGASGIPENNLTPGLYLGGVKIGSQNLAGSLAYITTNAVSGDDYLIVLGANESISPTSLNSLFKTVGITLLGYGSARTISLNANGSIFTVTSGVTLTLDENITLIGRSANNTSLVHVNSGNLIMNDGAKITGNYYYSSSSSSYGGGVYVGGSGTFTMSGGEISGNTSSSYGGGVNNGGTFTMSGGEISGNTSSSGGGVYLDSYGTFTMSDGTISGNTASTNGGGVYAYSNSRFTKTGGTIYGYASGDSNSNTVKNSSGTVLTNRGHAVYVNYSVLAIHRETTAGTEVNLSWNGTVNPPTFSGGWDY
jgi:hypothetical protein